jgi:hypothetical protein
MGVTTARAQAACKAVSTRTRGLTYSCSQVCRAFHIYWPAWHVCPSPSLASSSPGRCTPLDEAPIRSMWQHASPHGHAAGQNPPAVVSDCDASAGHIDLHIDACCVARLHLVHRVVQHLPQQVVEAAGAGAAYVHAGALADRLKAFQHLGAGVGARAVGARRGRGAEGGGKATAVGRPLLCVRVRSMVANGRGEGPQAAWW